MSDHNDLSVRSFTVAHVTGEKRPVVFLHDAEAEVERLREACAEEVNERGLLHDRLIGARDEVARLREALDHWQRKYEALKERVEGDG